MQSARRVFAAVLTASSFLLGAAFTACAPSPLGGFDAGGDGDGNDRDIDASAPVDADVCAYTSAEAELVSKPVDIIFVIDNSGSMGQEIQGVQDNINENFAQIIEASGVDYRVIMLTHHGILMNESVCIEAPLSGIPVGQCAVPPIQPSNNPPIFYHYSHEIASHDSWCRVLDRFDLPDDHDLSKTGYKEWLRPDAFKIFVEVTDDGVGCTVGGATYTDGNSVSMGQTAAEAFDAALVALSPTQFGTVHERNYRWYSLIALDSKDDNNPAEPWLPTDPLTTEICPTAADPGTGYQALSALTGGLRFPLCEPDHYDVVFKEIARGVIEGAAVACEFAIPDPPPGQVIDLDTVVVHYTPDDTDVGETFQQVPGEAACSADSFYITGDSIALCPDACDRVQADDNANIDIRFGCAVVIE